MLFMILSVLIFLKMGGVELNITLPSGNPNLDLSSSGSGYDDLKKYMLGGCIVGGIFAGIGLWRGWFS
jgi:hypothetical protein